jgi:hypothetical protein
MAIPGMDLQAQYEQTLQNTIGKSQRDRLQDVRKQQTLANTDWSQRGVGQGAQRMAGFQEVNPSSMPNMSDETRSFIKPLLGTYQEGGQNVEGFYGKENPYTQGGLESILTGQGYARAPSALEEQFKYAGLKLPNAYGQNYYNAQHESVGNDISKYQQQEQAWKQQQQQQQEQIRQQQEPARLYEENFKKLYSQLDPTKYRVKDEATTRDFYNRGFIPGQDNGDWRWSQGLGSPMMGYSWDIDINEPGIQTGQDPAEEAIYNELFNPEGAGTWYNKKYDADVRYSPGGGYYTADDLDKLSGSFHKYMPALTMAALSAMAPAAGAIASTAQSGLNTGNWGQALGKGALAYAGGELAGAYGGDLAGAFGGSSELANSIAQGAIRAGVNTVGNAALGNGVDWKGGLANLVAGAAGGALGGFAGDTVGGGLGKVVGGATRGLTTSALSNYLKGDTPGINTAIDTFAGAAGGLKGLFSNTNEDKPKINGPTSLAQTLKGMNNASTKTRGT